MNYAIKLALFWFPICILLDIEIISFFLLFIYDSKGYLNYLITTEQSGNLNAIYCKCDAQQPTRTGRIVNGTVMFDASRFPWVAALYYKDETLFGVICTGTGKPLID